MNKFILSMFNKFPRLFLWNVGMLLVSGVFESLALLTLAPLVDWFTMPNFANPGSATRYFLSAMNFFGISPTLMNILAVLLTLQIVANGFSVLAYASLLKTKYAVIQEVLLGSFQDFFKARFYFFSSNSQGTLLNTFSRAVSQVGDAFGSLGYGFVIAARLICYIAVPLTISWPITLLCSALCLLMVWPFINLSKRSYHLGQRNTSTANDLMSVVQESLNGAKVILGFGNEDKSAEDLKHSFQEHARATIKFQILTNATPSAYKPLGLLALTITLYAAKQQGVPLSEIAVLMLAFLQIIPLFGQMATLKNSVMNLIPAYELVESLRQEARGLEQRSGSHLFSSFEKELVMDKITFAYPGRAPVLNEISLRIQKGQFVAVVGESGVGKSTLIDLLMRLHEPSAGRILLDGVPLPEFSMTSYRGRIGFVPQESVLFNRSIRDNLLWAHGKASESEIRLACQQANADEFIDKMPQGYDTVVGDRGIRLSGGQAQRISLARAILRKPFLLILDEATSALDTHSERLIQKAIESIAKETTVIAIAHRLSTVMNADHIVLLKDGHVAEEGTYAHLVERDGLFRRMVHLQTLGEVN